MQTTRTNPFSPSASAQQRFLLIDALRGYALFGILLAHIVGNFAGWMPSHATSSGTKFVDLPLYYLNYIAVQNKFRPVFSFLFGVSFYIQLQQFETKQQRFTAIFLKRLLVLGMFGILHAYLIWWGDILRWYAVAGLVLLVLYRLPNRQLLTLAVVLTAVAPVLNQLIILLMPAKVADPARRNPWAALASDSFSEVFSANLQIVHEHLAKPHGTIVFVLTIVGYFLLGVVASRMQLFQRSAEYLRRFKLVGWGALVSGVAAGMGAFGFLWLVKRGTVPTHLGVDMLISVLFQVNTIGFFLFHICLIVVLYHHRYWRHWVVQLASPGRMTLTNYILQSVIGIVIFYGIGWGKMGEWSPVITFPLAIGLFIVQLLCSRWWLKRFKTGPLEALWRKLTQETSTTPKTAKEMA